MATDAEKVKKYREMANDKTIPQDVRNIYLDKANEIERKAFVDYQSGTSKTDLMQTNVKKKEMAKGGYATKKPMKMATGGYANCGASMAPQQKSKK